MQRFARVDKGVVVEIVQIPDDAKIEDCFHGSIVVNMHPCGEAVGQRWTFNGKTFDPPAED